MGFGSGFKCNSVVWKAIRNIHDTEHAEWAHMKDSANLDRCWNYIQVRYLLPASAGKISDVWAASVDTSARSRCGRRRAQRGSTPCTLVLGRRLRRPVQGSQMCDR